MEKTKFLYFFRTVFNLKHSTGLAGHDISEQNNIQGKGNYSAVYFLDNLHA